MKITDIMNEGKTGPGLWANIHAKRQRGERMRKKGEEGAPTEKALKAAQAGSKNESVAEGLGYSRDPNQAKWYHEGRNAHKGGTTGITIQDIAKKHGCPAEWLDAFRAGYHDQAGYSKNESVHEDKDPCWDNYQQVGMKTKGGRKVPNCVPKENVAEDLPPPENARKTQIAGTLPTYKKAAEILKKTGVQGNSLDFGAGLGLGTSELGPDAHSYEPFPNEKFKPHFVDVTKIPDNSYKKIVNLNVLNVVPNTGEHKIRDAIVRNIGRVLAPGGVALITTRGKDVLTIKGTPGEEPTSMISKIGTYQKGFTQTELKQYIRSVLGDGFEVSSIKLGPAGVMIKKLDQKDVKDTASESAENNDPYSFIKPGAMIKYGMWNKPQQQHQAARVVKMVDGVVTVVINGGPYDGKTTDIYLGNKSLLIRPVTKTNGTLNKETFNEDWRSEIQDIDDWANAVREKLKATPPAQRLSMAQKLSQIEKKNFDSETADRQRYNNQTGQVDANRTMQGLSNVVYEVYMDLKNQANSGPVAGGFGSVGVDKSELFARQQERYDTGMANHYKEHVEDYALMSDPDFMEWYERAKSSLLSNSSDENARRWSADQVKRFGTKLIGQRSDLRTGYKDAYYTPQVKAILDNDVALAAEIERYQRRNFEEFMDNIKGWRKNWNNVSDKDREKLANMIGKTVEDLEEIISSGNIDRTSLSNPDDIRENSPAGQPLTDTKGRTSQQWLDLVNKNYPDAQISQEKGPWGKIYAKLPDGRKLVWAPNVQRPANPGPARMSNPSVDNRNQKPLTNAEGLTSGQWEDQVMKQFPDAVISREKGPWGKVYAKLSDGSKLVWAPAKPNFLNSNQKVKETDNSFNRMMNKITSKKSIDMREALAMMKDLIYHGGASYKEALNQASTSFEIHPAKLQSAYQQYSRRAGSEDLAEGSESETYKVGDRVRHEDGTLGTVTQSANKQGLVQWKHAGGKNRVSHHSALKSAGHEQHRWRRQEQGVAEGSNGEYDDESGMAETNLHTIARAAQGLLDTIDDKENLPEWVQEKIAKVEGMMVTAWDYLKSQEEQGVDPRQGLSEVSKGTLDRYIPKAVDSHKHASSNAEMSKDDPTKRSYHKDQKRTAEKRQQGVSRALDRMSRNVDEQGMAGKGSQLEETYHDDDEFFEAYGVMEYNDEMINEAEYQGRKVTLNKPMRGDVAKFKVFVRDPKTGNVKKVNFGQKGARIKKHIPGRRKNFRARHNCDNPGPKTGARYWSCRKW